LNLIQVVIAECSTALQGLKTAGELNHGAVLLEGSERLVTVQMAFGERLAKRWSNARSNSVPQLPICIMGIRFRPSRRLRLGLRLTRGVVLAQSVRKRVLREDVAIRKFGHPTSCADSLSLYSKCPVAYARTRGLSCVFVCFRSVICSFCCKRASEPDLYARLYARCPRSYDEHRLNRWYTSSRSRRVWIPCVVFPSLSARADLPCP